MKVTVVITHYRRLAVLRRCVESILAQGDLVGEVLLVDDCSPDLTEDDIRQGIPTDPRIVIHRFASNRGVQAARNYGIDAAAHDFIAFMDCDDEWLPGKLAAQLSRLQSVQADLVSCEVGISWQGGAPSRRRWTPTFRGDPVRYIANQGGHLQTSTLLVRRDVAKAVRFDPDVRKFQDWDFVFRMHWAGYKVDLLPEVLSVYHFGMADQMTARPMPQKAQSFFDGHRARLGEPIYWRAMTAIVARMHAEVGEGRQAIGLWAKACLHLKALRIWDLLRILRRYRSAV